MERMEVVSLKMPKELRAALRAAAERLSETEPQFIRAAVAERLQSEKEPIPADILKPKSRKGVGGRPTHRTKDQPTIHIRPGGPHNFHPVDPSDPLILNESPEAEPPTPPGRRVPSSPDAKVDQDKIQAFARAVVASKIREVKGNPTK